MDGIKRSSGEPGIAVNVRALAQPTTGVQRYASELIKRLDGRVASIAPASPRSGIGGHVWEQLRLPSLLAGRLLWSPCNTGPLRVARQVVTIHDISPIDHPEWSSRQFSTWYRFMTPRLAQRVARVLTDAEFTKQRLVDATGIESDKVVVVPLGVDSRFQPVPDCVHTRMVADLALPSTNYVLTLSSLEPRKNLRRLLDAWRRIESLVPPEVWLVVAGARGSAAVFSDLQFGAMPPRVHFLGRVADEQLPALYSGAIAFAYMSEYEGFGLPPLEAMACGAPVISSDNTSLPEVVGNAGVMVSPYDVDAIAGAMLELIGDTAMRVRCRENGLQRARQYTWERTAELTWQVLQDAEQNA